MLKYYNLSSDLLRKLPACKKCNCWEFGIVGINEDILNKEVGTAAVLWCQTQITLAQNKHLAV